MKPGRGGVYPPVFTRVRESLQLIYYGKSSCHREVLHRVTRHRGDPSVQIWAHRIAAPHSALAELAM